MALMSALFHTLSGNWEKWDFVAKLWTPKTNKIIEWEGETTAKTFVIQSQRAERLLELFFLRLSCSLLLATPCLYRLRTSLRIPGQCVSPIFMSAGVYLFVCVSLGMLLCMSEYSSVCVCTCLCVYSSLCVYMSVCMCLLKFVCVCVRARSGALK